MTGRALITCLLASVVLAACLPTPATGEPPRVPARDEQRITRRYVQSWHERRRQNIVMQSKDYSCGAAALATLLQYFWGDEVGEERLLAEMDKMLTQTEIADRILNGLTLTDLRRLAVRLEYQATIGKLEFNELAESRVPVVVGVEVRDYKHFVVYRGSDGEFVYLADPARGNIRTPVGQFRQQWQDNAVLVVAKPNVDVPRTSALSVRYGERELGWLNRQVIRKNFLQFNPAIPAALRQ